MGTLQNLIAGLRGMRQSIEANDKELVKLEQEQVALDAMSPHLDDVVASAQSGIDAYAELALAKLRWHWNVDNLRVPHAAAQVEGPMAVLEPSNTRPAFTGLTVGAGEFDYRRGPADAAMLSLLLGEAMKQALPGIVAKVLPEARDGLRRADRAKRQADIDARRDRLMRDRDAVQHELDEARRAAGN